MIVDARPVIRCLVGRPIGTLGLAEIRRELADLDEAVDLLRQGYHVFVDPADEAAAARWDQLKRAERSQRVWRSESS